MVDKTLVLFVFHEFNTRVASFIRHAIFEDPKVDFIVISNKKTNEFKVPSYVRVLRRNNIGYDFGGWSDALLKDDFYKGYSSFIFANSSVLGPFMRPGDSRRWTDVYLEGLTEDVKLFGSTINTIGNPTEHSHVQSYIFAMGLNTLEHLISCGIFSMKNYVNGYRDAVFNREIAMSKRVIEQGWNIGSLMKHYNGVDFTFRSKKPHEYNIIYHDDPMFKQSYNILWNEYDVVFFKGNRMINISSSLPV